MYADNGELHLYVNKVKLRSIPYDYSKRYHLCGTIGNTGVGLSEVGMTLNPWQSATVDGITNIEEIHDGYENNYADNALKASPTKVSIKFPNADTANTYGFALLDHNKTALTGSFEGTNPIDEYHTPRSCAVELVNPSIKSWDGKTNRRRNLIAVIPNLTKEGLYLVYENDNPVMIDIRNEDAFLLSELHLRILGLNEVPLPIADENGATLTFVIED